MSVEQAPTPTLNFAFGLPERSNNRKAGDVFKFDGFTIKIKEEKIHISNKSGEEILTLRDWRDPEKVREIAEKLNIPSEELFLKISDTLAELETQERLKVQRIVFKDLGSLLLQEVFDGQVFRFILFDQRTEDWRFVDEYQDPILPILYKPTIIPISKLGLPRVVLPTKPEIYENEAKLLEEVACFIRKFVELNDEDLWLTARFVLHTWVYDVGDYAIQALVLGQFGSGKTRLFKILRLLCYNALGLGGGSSLSSYRRLQERFRGALLVNEFQLNNTDDSSEIIQWLNNGFERDLPIALSDKKDPVKQQFFDPFCPKLFTSRNMIDNVATRSRLIIIKMQQKTRTDIPIQLPKEAYEEAAKLRNKLLSFRLKHFKVNFELPNDIDFKLREATDIDDRFKQTMLPMLLLYSLIGLDVEEVFKFYRKQQMLFKLDIATGTVEGIVFNTLIELCRLENFNEPEFWGWIDEDKKLVGVGSSLLKHRTGFSVKTIAKALERIGLKQEKVSTKVLTWNINRNEPEVKVRTLRFWRFPDEKTWQRAYQVYCYREDPVPTSATSATSAIKEECPTVLRSSGFIVYGTCGTCGTSRDSSPFEPKPSIYKQLNSKQTIGPLGSVNSGQMSNLEEKEGLERVSLESSIHTYPLKSVISVTSATSQEVDKQTVNKQDNKNIQTDDSLGEFVNLGKGEDASKLRNTPEEALPSISRVDAVYKDASSSPSNELSASIPNEVKVSVSGTISPEAVLRIKELNDCTPFNPLYMNSTCYACGTAYEGLWRQVSRGFSIYQLCDDCFKEWSKHF
jgi:hypothetical protein